MRATKTPSTLRRVAAFAMFVASVNFVPPTWLGFVFGLMAAGGIIVQGMGLEDDGS